MARKLERMALDAAALASNLREASQAMPGRSGGAASPGGNGGLADVLRRLDALNATLGQVSANVSGNAAAYRLGERLAGG